MKKITIAIVDDHRLIREMWAQLFAGKSEFEITGESGTFNEAIEMIIEKTPDIILLDINLADASGLDAVPLIRKFSPGTRIIAVSMHSQPVYAKKMLQLGAKAYVTKNSSHEEVFKAIEEVMKGGVYVCAEIKNILVDNILNDDPMKPNITDLSYREVEIVKAIKQGLSSKEIAVELGITPKTVEVHRHNILKKLNMKNTAALINFINTNDPSF